MTEPMESTWRLGQGSITSSPSPWFHPARTQGSALGLLAGCPGPVAAAGETNGCGDCRQ